MASLYYRGDAIWINYKGEDGRWHSKTSGYRKSNPGQRRQAELLRDKQTLRERTERPTVHAAGWDWVDSWIEARWGSSEATTPKLYRSEWKTLQKWLAEIEVKGPATLRREQCQQYPQWNRKGFFAANRPQACACAYRDCQIPAINRCAHSFAISPILTTTRYPPACSGVGSFDSLEINGVSHHDLRRTWITKAAMSGIPESVACKFCNHSSLTVHRIYQKFSIGDMAEMLTRLQ
jgi:hypothetical protein